jgi:hypothetical protein
MQKGPTAIPEAQAPIGSSVDESTVEPFLSLGGRESQPEPASLSGASEAVAVAHLRAGGILFLLRHGPPVRATSLPENKSHGNRKCKKFTRLFATNIIFSESF